jgi:hypothetical protein
MTNAPQFQKYFKHKDFDRALDSFLSMNKEQQLELLKTLYQASSNQKEPFMISVLRGHLSANDTFEDFYQSWLPPAEACDPIEYCGEKYLQLFGGPTRVINAVNMHDPDDIMSIGVVWAETEEAKQKTLAAVKSAQSRNDKVNEDRHDSIKENVSDRELLGIYLVKKDDNLGTPF